VWFEQRADHGAGSTSKDQKSSWNRVHTTDPKPRSAYVISHPWKHKIGVALKMRFPAPISPHEPGDTNTRTSKRTNPKEARPRPSAHRPPKGRVRAGELVIVLGPWASLALSGVFPRERL